MDDILKKLKQLYKKANAEDKAYAEQLLTWLNEWLKPKPGGIEPSDEGGGNNPPPPPPHK